MATPMVTGPVSIWALVPGKLVELELAAAALAPFSAASLIASAAAGVALALSNLRQTAIFVGHGLKAPKIVEDVHTSPVYSDLAGPDVPYDKIYTGEDCVVSVTLTRWNEKAVRILRGMPRPGTAEGLDGLGERGTLMASEGYGYPLILRFPFWDLKPYFKANGGTPGIRYYCAFLEGRQEHQPGTEANTRTLSWYCQNVYNPKNNGFGLYDYNVTGIPVLAPE